MNVSSEPYVVSEIPAIMIRIFVNDDLVGIPKPVGAVIDIGGCHAEVEATEPESRRASAGQPERMPFPDTPCEMAVLPGTVKMVARVRAAGLVAYPLIVLVYVGSFRMTTAVGEGARFGRALLRGSWLRMLLRGTRLRTLLRGTRLWPRRRLNLRTGRSVRRDVSVAYVLAWWMLSAPSFLLPKHRN